MTHSLFLAALLFTCPLQATRTEYRLHPLHLSRSVVEYSPDNHLLTATAYIFLDDLEAALKKQGTSPLYLCTPRESSSADQYLESYFEKHFRITAGGRKMHCRLLGKELSDDGQAAWCYIEFSPVPGIGKVKVNCSILTEMYADQKNLVHFVIPGAPDQTALLSRNRTEAVFVLAK